MSAEPVLTVIVTCHREHHLVGASLASAVSACGRAAKKSVPCRIYVVLDRSDVLTRTYLEPFAENLDTVFEVDFGDLSLARNHAIAHVATPFVTFLDGDDLFSDDWLWRGVCHLERFAGEPVVGHAEVRMTFGSAREGRVQIPTASPLFHPLYLISSWQYATDTIAPTELFRKYPYRERDERCGLAAEDWLWTCETVAGGVRHVIVPETSYFYRRQENHVSLGLLPGITFPRTDLFDKEIVEKLRQQRPPSLTLTLAQDQPLLSSPRTRLTGIPPWLKRDVEAACDRDLSVYPLYRWLETVPLVTPEYYPPVAVVYEFLIDLVNRESSAVVIFAERFDQQAVCLVDSMVHCLCQCNDCRIDVLCLAVGTGAGHGSVVCERSGDGVSVRFAALGGMPPFACLPARLRYDVLTRFLLQVAPLAMINLESQQIDDLVGLYGRAFQNGTTKTLRVCRGRYPPRFDPLAHLQWRGLIASLARYTHVLCESKRLACWLADYFNGAACQVLRPDTETANDTELQLGLALAGSLGLPPCPKPWGGSDRVACLPVRFGSGVRVGEVAGDRVDVSCVVSVSREGYFVNQTIQAILGMCSELEKHGHSSEVIVVAQCPGPITASALRRLAGLHPCVSVDTVAYRDTGRALNEGIRRSGGRFIAIFNGSDLLSPGWLREAAIALERGEQTDVYHPGCSVGGEEGMTVSPQPEQGERGWKDAFLQFCEGWRLPVVACRDVFLQIPYPHTPEDSGCGPAWWLWNDHLVRSGYRHRTVRTCAIFPREQCRNGESIVALGRKVVWRTLPAFPESLPMLPGSMISVVIRSLRKASEMRTLAAHLSRDANVLARWEPSLSGAAISIPQQREVVLFWLIRISTMLLLAVKRRLISQGDDVATLAQAEQQLVRRAVNSLRPISRFRPFSWIFRFLQSTVANHDPNQLFRLYHLTRVYYSMSRELFGGCHPTHVFITNGLQPGGSRLSMDYCVEEVLRDPNNRVCIVTTEPSPRRPNKIRRSPRCRVAALGDVGRDLEPDERVEVLARFLLNSRGRCLHLFYSWAGWQCFSRYGSMLSAHACLFVSIFSIPPVRVSSDPGYAVLLGSLLPHLSGVISDNNVAAARLECLYGLKKQTLHVLRHPTRVRQRFQPPGAGNDLILWAGRVDRDKKPDLLVAISERLPWRAFYAYGINVLGGEHLLQVLRKKSNIHYRGGFDGFDAIEDMPFGIFLYTGIWEGMPNVILEACRSGLLVVAPDIGGIREVVNNERGVLLGTHPRVEDYCQAIEEIFSDPEHFGERARKGTEHVCAHYTDKAFSRAVRLIPGYL
ncbi:glycosyltransferase [Desulfofustis glycolicus]|uniref:Glycosyl transferase family 2 n=1 Tax=Desulfofustis glycolicus DSM 9705 TaxID=1121409 RepID=A0A1M5TMY4_9BACT|nr:glycosyltransferase [Desulfofustis glycolicus]SHH52165.1 Glycosyl transferase family 2 [Desulfofustis glycolicus DSM 9705]